MWRDHSQGLLLFKMESVSKASFFPPIILLQVF